MKKILLKKITLKKDITGQTFGRLTAIKQDGFRQQYTPMWHCVCSCGNTTLTSIYDLTKGRARSCGCVSLEKITMTGMKNKTHGQSKSPVYLVWVEIKRRCYDPKRKSFKWYGAKGIIVAPEWLDASRFLTDMGGTFFVGAQIDRIDNSKGYSKENCRWVTPKQQQNNRTNNHLVTYLGETRTLMKWCDLLEIPYGRTFDRLGYNWTAERAFTTPVRGKSSLKI